MLLEIAHAALNYCRCQLRSNCHQEKAVGTWACDRLGNPRTGGCQSQPQGGTDDQNNCTCRNPSQRKQAGRRRDGRQVRHHRDHDRAISRERGGCHIQYAFGGFVRYEQDGALSDHGRARAESILVDIYSRSIQAEAVRRVVRDLPASQRKAVFDFARATVRDVHAELAHEAPVDDVVFYALRRALRRDLRAGLAEHTYQRRYSSLQKRRAAHHRQHQLVLERVASHLAALLQIDVSYNVVGEILEQELGLVCCVECHRICGNDQVSV